MRQTNPIDFLHRIDIDIRVNRWHSRQEAFEDYVWRALEELYPPNAIRFETVFWMAQHLLQEAEKAEEFSLLLQEESNDHHGLSYLRNISLQMAN